MTKNTNNHSILIVDDDPLTQKTLEHRFNKEGFKIFIASDGEEGLAKAIKEHPDIILLDLLMPKIDGIKMLEKLREDPWGKTAGVLLLTNLNDTEKVAEAVAKGVYEYLVKSDWKIDDIVAKVHEKLALQDSQKEK
ncbi:MAG: response regulator [bacterium]|nr:response regulator [bacterium]